jgi:hypothetical protein
MSTDSDLVQSIPAKAAAVLAAPVPCALVPLDVIDRAVESLRYGQALASSLGLDDRMAGPIAELTKLLQPTTAGPIGAA